MFHYPEKVKIEDQLMNFSDAIKRDDYRGIKPMSISCSENTIEEKLDELSFSNSNNRGIKPMSISSSENTIEEKLDKLSFSNSNNNSWKFSDKSNSDKSLLTEEIKERSPIYTKSPIYARSPRGRTYHSHPLYRPDCDSIPNIKDEYRMNKLKNHHYVCIDGIPRYWREPSDRARGSYVRFPKY